MVYQPKLLHYQNMEKALGKEETRLLMYSKVVNGSLVTNGSVGVAAHSDTKEHVSG